MDEQESFDLHISTVGTGHFICF